MTLANQVVILDFETTGLSPDNGDRAIEIGAVSSRKGLDTVDGPCRQRGLIVRQTRSPCKPTVVPHGLPS